MLADVVLILIVLVALHVDRLLTRPSRRRVRGAVHGRAADSLPLLRVREERCGKIRLPRPRLDHPLRWLVAKLLCEL